MLSMIRRALALISDQRGESFALQDIPAKAPTAYEMIGRADTIGVFQIESRAQMTMLPWILPRTFYDLVIEVAIVRPGPIQSDMVHPYRGELWKPAKAASTLERRLFLNSAYNWTAGYFDCEWPATFKRECWPTLHANMHLGKVKAEQDEVLLLRIGARN